MAEILGVTLRTYQDWEGGVRVPAWRNLQEIADKLEIDVGELVGTTDPELPEPPTEAGQLSALREELAELHGMVAELLQRSA